MIKASTVFVLFIGILLGKDWISKVWPWGFAKPWLDRPQYIQIDYSNDKLQSKRKNLLSKILLIFMFVGHFVVLE